MKRLGWLAIFVAVGAWAQSGNPGGPAYVPGPPFVITLPLTGQCLTYNGTVWVNSTCGTSTGAPFSGITSGTNTTAAMVVGSGGSITTSGTGTIGGTFTGGTVDNSPIGSTTPSTGTFTIVTGTTDVTSPSVIGTLGNFGAIGSVTPGSGVFTTISATSISGTLNVPSGGSITTSGTGTINTTPTGATTAQSVASLTSPTNYQVPRTHVNMFKPWAPQAYTQDTGTTFGNKTSIYTFEIPSDATMAQLVLANGFGNAFTLTSAGTWGSSELLASSATSGSAGITPYDGSGNAITALSIFSFGNNGVDVFPSLGFPSTAPANLVSGTFVTSGSTSAGATSIVFGATGFACPPDGSTLLILASTATNNPLLYPGTTQAVSGCNAGTETITLSQGTKNIIPTGTTSYWLPPTITVAASTTQPLPASLIYSDWAPIETYTRLDGPVMSGMTILNAGTPLTGTVSSTTSTTATMSSNLSADIPAGTALQACRVGTTSGSVTPNLTVQFATNSNIVAGQIITVNSRSLETYYWQQNTVSSVSSGGGNTTVTLTSPFGELDGLPTIYSGVTFYFFQPVTLTSTANTGQAVVNVASTAGLSTGMSSAVLNGTILTINSSTQFTMSANITTAVASGTTIYPYFSATSNANSTSSTGIVLASAVPFVYAGMTAVASGYLPSNDYVMYSYYNSLTDYVTSSPTTTIPNGTTVYFCNNVTTSTDSPSGQEVINFPTTVYKNRLVTVRLNYAASTSEANYYESFADQSAFNLNISGNPLRATLGYQCTTATGVLSPSTLSPTAGGCGVSPNDYAPFFAMKFYSPQRGITVASVGDSHMGGTTSYNNSTDYVEMAASEINNPEVTPVWPVNLGWFNQPSMIYGPLAQMVINDLKPSVAVIQYVTPNDTTTNYSYANMTATANALASEVESYGGLPVLAADYQRQAFGLSLNSAADETIRLNGIAGVDAAIAGGAVGFDPNPYLADPTNGSAYMYLPYTSDWLHANSAGHAAIAVGLKSKLCTYIRC